MAPKTRARKNSTTSNPPASMPPTNLDAGIIDIKVLANIHHYLSESSQDDDLALAAWVKENYLYEPLDIESRDISTAEGFFNLERAWRRVRTLTGKAVDKWPFFYSSWKKMTAPIVRKNAQGPDASGVSMPATANSASDSTMSNKQSASEANIRAPTPGLDAAGARSTRQTRRRAQSSEPPALYAPTSLPPMKKQFKSRPAKAPTPGPDASGTKAIKQTRRRGQSSEPPTVPAPTSVALVKKESKGDPNRAITPGPDASVARSTRQAGRRARSSEPPASNAPVSQPSMKKESRSNSSTTLPTIAEAVEESIVDTASASASGNIPNEDQPVKPVRGYEPPWTEPPVLKTNLDKLPPKSLLAKKRKAEAATAAAQEGPRPKRSRTQSSKESSKTPAPDGPTRMATRRTTRNNAAKKPSSPEPSMNVQGSITEGRQAPTLHGVDLNKFGKPTPLQPQN